MSSATAPITANEPVYSTTDYSYSGTAYINNVEYKISKNNQSGSSYIDTYTALKLNNPEGCVNNPGGYAEFYYYYRKDHLGNIREIWQPAFMLGSTAVSAWTPQKTQYYPSGLPWQSNSDDYPEKQPYKYNGKEFIEMHGWDETDLGARGLHHAKMRFNTMDRFAEKYPWQSPYCFAGNNPANYLDVNGDSIWVSVYNQNTNTNDRYYYGTDANGNAGFIDNAGNLYSGNDNFVNSLTSALAELSSGSVGKDLVQDLSNSKKNIDIIDSRDSRKQNRVTEDRKGILWNPENTEGGMSQNGTTSRQSFVGLGHEMAHIQDIWNKTYDNSTWITIDGQKIPRAEIYATHVENQIRAEHKISLRTHYVIMRGRSGIYTGYEPTRIIVNSESIYYYNFNNQGYIVPFNYYR